MRISEIIKARPRAYAKPKTARAKAVIKGPYAPPPKPLPKPKPIKLTPLQLKQRQQKNIQAYAKVVQKTLGPNKLPQSPKYIPSVQPTTPTPIEQHRTSQEMDIFLKHIRGENLGKPGL